MIYIGVIIIINNAENSTQIGKLSVEPEKTHIHCPNEGCEWDDIYPSPGRAKQALGGHRSWCDKLPPTSRHKKRMFG